MPSGKVMTKHASLTTHIRGSITAVIVVITVITGGVFFNTHAAQATTEPPPANEPISSDVCEAGSAAADTEVCLDQSTGRLTVLGSNSIFELIVNIIVMLVGVFSVIMIIIGGFRYVLSGGDSSSTKSAKDTIMYALIGLVIAIFSRFIVTLVLNANFFK